MRPVSAWRTGPTASVPHTRDQQTGSFDVNGDILVDFDRTPPEKTPISVGSTAADLQIGPDNVYPQNGATVWYKQAPGPCSSQSGEGGTQALQWNSKMQGKPDIPIEVCTMTNLHTFYLLSVSTSRADGGFSGG